MSSFTDDEIVARGAKISLTGARPPAGAGAVQGHWFWHQSKARIWLPIRPR